MGATGCFEEHADTAAATGATDRAQLRVRLRAVRHGGASTSSRSRSSASERRRRACGMRVKAARGGASGGTVASLINVAEEAGSRPLRAGGPSPTRTSLLPRGRATVGPPAGRHASPQREDAFDGGMGRSFRPWLRSTRVSCCGPTTCSSDAWGEDFRYDEGVLTGKGPKGAAVAAGHRRRHRRVRRRCVLQVRPACCSRRSCPSPARGPIARGTGEGLLRPPAPRHTTASRRRGRAHEGHRRPATRATARRRRSSAEAGVCLAQDVADRDTAGRRRVLDPGEPAGPRPAPAPRGPCRAQLRGPRAMTPRTAARGHPPHGAAATLRGVRGRGPAVDCTGASGTAA